MQFKLNYNLSLQVFINYFYADGGIICILASVLMENLNKLDLEWGGTTFWIIILQQNSNLVSSNNNLQGSESNQNFQNALKIQTLYRVSNCWVRACIKLDFCWIILSFGSSKMSFSGFSSSSLAEFEFWGLNSSSIWVSSSSIWH